MISSWPMKSVKRTGALLSERKILPAYHACPDPGAIPARWILGRGAGVRVYTLANPSTSSTKMVAPPTETSMGFGR